MHKYNKYENDWKKDLIYYNILPKILTENKFKFISHCLHLPINSNDLDCNNDEFQNDDDSIIENEYKGRKQRINKYEKEVDPHLKVKEFLEAIIENQKNI